MNIQIGEVWSANVPFEEDNTKSTIRPVIVLDVETFEVLSVKVTKSPPREYDKYDFSLLYGTEANLRFIPSTARISKTIKLNKTRFHKKIGDLHPDDFETVQNKYIEYLIESN